MIKENAIIEIEKWSPNVCKLGLNKPISSGNMEAITKVLLSVAAKEEAVVLLKGKQHSSTNYCEW